MVRGHAKAQAQARNAAKQGNKKGSQLEAQQAVTKVGCPICKVPTPSYKLLTTHYDSKHPKETVPAEETFRVK
ncbi:At2g23090 like protein [Phakopsora pachyrhizi]|uniref:At2g23090 like protein n=1 Tax=Phakopsora pachyrhizi TaxID=170000 RepID=A0AAV0B4P9_PHAPC|nr:At2g23090 like protein [Phakopsora pachyrhizi]